VHTLIVQQGRTFKLDLPLAEISDLLAAPHTVVWLDLQNPDEADVALLADEFGFHPLAIEDAIRSHERPKVDAYAQDEGDNEADDAARGEQGYYFVVFYEATLDDTAERLTTEAINLFIGANFLVTVHHGDIRHVKETLARWQTPNSPLGNSVGALVHALLDSIVDDYFPLMDRVADRVEDLEDAIFVHYEEESIQAIFGLKRDLLSLRRVVAPERDVLNVLLRRELPLFRQADVVYLQDVYDHLVRVTDNIDTYRDLLSSALDSYLSLQSNNLNQVVKVLTIASIILMADSLIAGIYGMNFVHMPELQWRIGHGFALLLMGIITVGLVVYFKRKRWL
jgi:magnesium transporter